VGGFHKSLVSLARDLTTLGHAVTFVQCVKAMSSGCTAMRALGVNDLSPTLKKAEICEICQSEARAIPENNKWNIKYLYPVRNQSISNKWKNTRLAKYASYELLLEHKIEKIPSRGDFVHCWRERYNRLVGIFPQAKKIFTENKYNAVICYNSIYGIHRVFCYLAKQQKIPALSLSHSNNFGRENEYNLIPEHTFYFYKELQKCFISRKNLNDYELSAIRDHYAGLLGGNKPWNYSEPSETKKIKKDYIRKDKKVLVCLSSPDENFAAQTVGILQTNLAHAFKNQLQWLKWVKKIAQKNPKILFWIRPHPRLYPNKRDSRHSELSTKLKLLRENKRR
jgi:hypothetical protein